MRYHPCGQRRANFYQKPGVAILHTTYAVYHLARSSKGRTPTSSASYMIFAAIMDAGLIPFLVFTAILSRNQYNQGTNVSGHWQTLFDSVDATFRIVYSTFLVSVVGGSLHLVSLIISIYLAVIFRKISKLPPDMNPFEDNLTSRHKRNKSSRIDNHTSQSTDATATNRGSKAQDPLISPPRTVPFLHTRTESLTNHPLSSSSPRASRIDNVSPLYDESERNLERNLHKNMNNQSSPTRASSVYSDVTHMGQARAISIHPPSNRPGSITPTIVDESENWIEYPSSSPSPLELKHLRTPYQPVPQSLPFDPEKFIPRPLEMNPPTPPLDKRRPVHHERVLVAGKGNSTILGSRGSRKQGYEGLGNGKLSGTGRVISRTGVEIDGANDNRGVVRVREVSGKVAEEGRGDRMWRERGGARF